MERGGCSKAGASQSDSLSVVFEIFTYCVNIRCKLKTSEKRRTEYSIEELFVNQGKVITVELQWLEH